MSSETVTITKKKYDAMKREIKILRNSEIYKSLIEFEKSIATGKKYYRKDLGF
ncbi:MAG TPA: hypothetical protein VFF13_05800 [archaeon]|nr:hypothetical protein [archaeon]